MEIEKLVREYETIVERMEQAFLVNGKEGRRICAELEEIMKRLAEILCEDNEDAKKKIGGAIMGGTAWKTLGERIEEAEQEKVKIEQEKMKVEQEKAQAEQKIRIYKSYFIEHLGEQEIAERENIPLEEVCEILELDLVVDRK